MKFQRAKKSCQVPNSAVTISVTEQSVTPWTYDSSCFRGLEVLQKRWCYTVSYPLYYNVENWQEAGHQIVRNQALLALLYIEQLVLHQQRCWQKKTSALLGQDCCEQTKILGPVLFSVLSVFLICSRVTNILTWGSLGT